MKKPLSSRTRGPIFYVRCLPLFLFLFLSNRILAQVSPTVPATTHQHNKQVIGYITQWDAWKNVAGLVPQGGYNQLNVDYSQYTILNFSFFGVAVDGSLHSGDYRNPNIYQVGAVQNPAPLVDSDIYSSWDMFLLNGELTTEYYISDGDDAYQLGYRNQGSGWTNINTGASGAFPLSVHKSGGALGVIDLAHQKGVKVMASIGGWSMCKHYPEMAADANRRSKFIAGCLQLMSMGFDGIDLDWEYPNDPGMDIEHYSAADFANFAALVEQIRAAIGSSKLITACFSPAPAKLQGFDWQRLDRSMNYFNIMTYDYNGGWSNKAGHNAPLYDYPNEEFSSFSVDATVKSLRQLGVNMSKVNLGAPFYGRGVITSGTAALNGATTKRSETVQPDGPIQTCADYTNWSVDVWEGTPNYSYVLQTTGSGSGWTDHWDDVAKVPYMTKGNYFLSYDNPRSISAKALYIKDSGLAGAIVWHVFGDMVNMTSSTVAKGKLIYCPNTQSPLVNTINQVFANGSTPPPPGNIPPLVTLTTPVNNAVYSAPAMISLQASASDSDGTIAKVDFFNGGTLLGETTTAPYKFAWTNVTAGAYSLTAVATDNGGAIATSPIVTITVRDTSKPGGGTDTTGGGTGNCSGVAAWIATTAYNGGAKVVYSNSLYTAKWWTQGEQPDLNTGDGKPWQLVSACSGPTPPDSTGTGGGNTGGGSDTTGNPGGGTSGNCAGIPTYQPYPAIYNQGDKVVYNGKLYQSTSNSLYNVTPGTADWWWTPLGSCTTAAAKTILSSQSAQPLIASVNLPLNIYPNPVTGSSIQIQVSAQAGEQLSITVSAVTGSTPVIDRAITAGLQGPQLISLDLGSLPAGIWVLSIKHPVSGRKETAKIIRIR